MDREYTEITLPISKTIVKLKKWLTGGEKIDMNRAESTDAGSTEAMIKLIVVSPSIEDVRELHGKDFDFLLNELRQVIVDSSWDDKKKA